MSCGSYWQVIIQKVFSLNQPLFQILSVHVLVHKEVLNSCTCHMLRIHAIILFTHAITKVLYFRYKVKEILKYFVSCIYKEVQLHQWKTHILADRIWAIEQWVSVCYNYKLINATLFKNLN